MHFLKFGVMALIFIVPTLASADNYKIDKDHSSVTFSIRHLVSKVTGSFTDVSGNITLEEKNISKSSVTAEIKTTSIDTHVQKRDDHLRSPDFFDASKNPDIKFTSKKVSGTPKKLKIEGTLSLHGVEKPVTLKGEFLGNSKDPWGNTRAGFTASTQINRKDFGLSWNKALEAGGFLIGDDVTINLDVEAIKEMDASKEKEKAPAGK